MEHAAIAARIYAHLQELIGDLAAFACRQESLSYNYETFGGRFRCNSYGDRWLTFGLVGDPNFKLQLDLATRAVLPHTLGLSDGDGYIAVLAQDDQERCARYLALLCEHKREGDLTLEGRHPLQIDDSDPLQQLPIGSRVVICWGRRNRRHE